MGPVGERLTLGGVLLAAAIVRLYRIDLTWFFLDQVRDISTASNIVAGKSFPLVGPLVGWTHGHLGPLYYYIVAIPFAFTSNPMAGAVFVVLANVLAVFLLHRFAKEFFGASTALIAAALFAVFPLAVISSRVLWNPGLVPLFTLLFMRALFDLIVNGRSRAVPWALALLAVLTQIHLTTVALGGVALLAVALFRPKIEPRHALLGLALFMFLYSPYLLHELTHRFENIRALLSVTMADQGVIWARTLAAVIGNLLILYRSLLNGFVVADSWPPQFHGVFSILYGLESLLFGLGMLIALYGVARGLRDAAPQEVRARRSIALLFLWIAVPVLLLGTRRRPVWWYHLDLLYPTQFIFTGLALTWLSSLKAIPAAARRVAAGVSAGLVLAIVLIQGYFDIGLQQRTARQGAILLDGRGMSVNSLSSPFEVLTTLPYGYRHKIFRTMLDRWGVEESAFPRRVHGAVLGVPEENRYLLRHLAMKTGASRRAAAPAGAHYLVARDWIAALGPKALRSRRVGPYTVVEYIPIIDYGRWSYAVVSGGSIDGLAPLGWKSLELPAADLDITLPGGEALVGKGMLRIPDGAMPGTVTVAVFSDFPLRKIEGWLDARRLAPVAERSARSLSLYWVQETVFDLGQGWRPGDQPFVIAVVGGTSGPVRAVDVYEGGGR